MREIKFRAWDGHWFISKELMMSLNDGSLFIDYGSERYDDAVIEQYTGVKDVNGNEIYEGDILIDPDDGRVYGVVEFDNGEFSADGDRLYDEAASTYVGGNIHENPELLEGE